MFSERQLCSTSEKQLCSQKDTIDTLVEDLQ